MCWVRLDVLRFHLEEAGHFVELLGFLDDPGTLELDQGAGPYEAGNDVLCLPQLEAELLGHIVAIGGDCDFTVGVSAVKLDEAFEVLDDAVSRISIEQHFDQRVGGFQSDRQLQD